jgi:hypothetical protein
MSQSKEEEEEEEEDDDDDDLYTADISGIFGIFCAPTDDEDN